jgi:hypothetical protein
MKTLRLIVATLTLLLGTSIYASASTVTIILNTEFSGGTAPAGPAPWATVTFKDTGLNTVELTMQIGSGVGAGAFVTDWYFNLDPLFGAPTGLNIASLNTSAVGNTLWTASQKAANPSSDATFKADGDGFFDVRLDFTGTGANGGANRFTAGESVSFTLTGTNLSAASFDFLSEPGGGNGSWTTAAHMQGLVNGGSGWIGGTTVGSNPTGIPEPSSIILLGTALIGAAVVRRRKI